MLSKVVEYIKEFCELEGYDFRDTYRGRFMYDKTCVGIVCDDTDYTFMKLVGFLGEKELTGVCSILGEPCTDNMGLSYILYFPSVSTSN